MVRAKSPQFLELGCTKSDSLMRNLLSKIKFQKEKIHATQKSERSFRSSLMLLRNARNNTERTARVYKELSQAAQNPDRSTSISPRKTWQRWTDVLR